MAYILCVGVPQGRTETSEKADGGERQPGDRERPTAHSRDFDPRPEDNERDPEEKGVSGERHVSERARGHRIYLPIPCPNRSLLEQRVDGEDAVFRPDHGIELEFCDVDIAV